MSIIQKFFSSNPFIMRKILKPESIINQVSPNLFQNLRDSSKQFIKGVANKDISYIKQVSGNAIGSRLTQQLQENKDNDFNAQYHLDKYNLDNYSHFQISPYVIFGQDFTNRIHNIKLWENIRHISSNRFIKFDSNLSFIQRFKLYGQKQIFGFHCIYYPSISKSQQSNKFLIPHPFMVSFETDSTNIDFFVIDCQGAIFQDWRANNFRT